MSENLDLDAVLRLTRTPTPLPEPEGCVVRVTDVDQLRDALESADPNTTILVAAGIYEIPEQIFISADRLTIRGETSDREQTVLDGMGRFGRMLTVKGASDLVIADLTVRNSKQYGILILGDSDAQRTRIHNVKFHNVWVRGLKGTHPARIDDNSKNLHPPEVVEKVRPKDGQVRHCLFINDTAKPYDDDGFDGDYVSGLDMMGLSRWVFADNVFVGIRGKNGGARGAIFVWVESDHCIAERNIFINCDRCIAFGNPSGDWPHMTAGIVRDNFIAGGNNISIEMSKTVDSIVCHNSVYATKFDYPRTIDFAETKGGRLVNNIIHGRTNLDDDVTLENNHVGDCSGWFADPSIADLHLTDEGASAANGERIEEAGNDFDGKQRGERARIGAVE